MDGVSICSIDSPFERLFQVQKLGIDVHGSLYFDQLRIISSVLLPTRSLRRRRPVSPRIRQIFCSTTMYLVGTDEFL